MHMGKVPADKAKGETGEMGWVIQATGLLCLALLSDSGQDQNSLRKMGLTVVPPSEDYLGNS